MYEKASGQLRDSGRGGRLYGVHTMEGNLQSKMVRICCQSSWMTTDTPTKHYCCGSILEDGRGVCGGVGVGKACGWARQGPDPEMLKRRTMTMNLR